MIAIQLTLENLQKLGLNIERDPWTPDADREKQMRFEKLKELGKNCKIYLKNNKFCDRKKLKTNPWPK